MPSGHINADAPLKPLTEHARGWLKSLAAHRYPAAQINPGVRLRLTREGLAEYETVGLANFVKITDAGRTALAEARG